MTDVTFILGYEEGSTAEHSYTFTDTWEVTSVPEGLSVYPMSGESGTAVLTVTALTDNPAIGERVSTFTILSGNEAAMTVIQRGTPGLLPGNTSYSVSDMADTIEIQVGANITFSAAGEEEWIEIISVNASDSILLSDGKTRSDSLLYNVTVGIQANSGNEERAGTVLLSYGQEDATAITIHQSAPLAVDWDRDFYRTSVFIRMTATWCYNCPFMSEAISVVQERMPDRIIPVSVHALSSEGGLAYYNSPDIEELYSVTGYPTGVANNMAKFRNIRSVDDLAVIVEGITEEAISSYPSSTGIDATSRLDGNTVNIDTKIAVKDAGEYGICIMLLENGINYEQAGTGGEDYVHNSVLREILTGNLNGTALAASSGNEVLRFSLEANVPRSVLNPDNISVVIVVCRSGSPEIKSVNNVEYLELGSIWDNAAILPANGSVGLKYEN